MRKLLGTILLLSIMTTPLADGVNVRGDMGSASQYLGAQ